MLRTLPLLAVLLLAAPATAQPNDPGRVDVAFNRYYDVEETHAIMRDIAAAYPELVELRTLGRSGQGRELLVAIVTDRATGAHDVKPAMWIDGNVHGNEIQASEVVLYTLWYLCKEHGSNERITELLEASSFYLMPIVNPDGRAHWFSAPNTSSTSRHNIRPVDDDRDGLVDEDPADDLDGDGSITRMWKRDPNGRFVRDRQDPRIFRRVDIDEEGEWTPLGREGIDNDGDGRINEDQPFGDDMNRNWPGDWKPTYVQWRAGPYPLSAPETRAIATFILGRPNIAAAQSYHNTGGMVLRGPGTSYRRDLYPRTDLRVYDRIADLGARMLPGYRSLVIFSDLYEVHGGFITWTSETLGIIGFTNELWTSSNYFYRDGRPDEDDAWLWRDRIAFGELFTDYTEVEHPTYGTVLVGGPNKWASRSTPVFMLEEECHRNFAFTMLHADAMPRLRFGEPEVEQLEDGLWSIVFDVHNDRDIPTRTGLQVMKDVGRPDLLVTSGEARVVAAGEAPDRFRPAITEPAEEPDRVPVSRGIPGHGSRRFRLVVAGEAGDTATIDYRAERARDVSMTVELAATED